jgi:hypothetical protein
VAVVERDPELAVAEGLDDLALQLDLLFFDSDGCSFLRRVCASKVAALRV